MSGDLVSVRILAAFGTTPDRELFRQAANLASVPIDVMDIASGSARSALARGEFDFALIDATVPTPDLSAFIATARSVPRAPIILLVAAAAWEAGEFKAGGVLADGVVTKPTKLDQASALIDRCVQLRIPNRVLVVDDSATMRSIVRKLLAGTRFVLDVVESAEGVEALKLLASSKFDIVFLDNNMPGLTGVETLSEIKRQHPRTKVVLMTSTPNETLAERARAAGAAAFLKKPFYSADIEAVLYSLHGLR
jgi:CheY-like chemotaxis protein